MDRVKLKNIDRLILYELDKNARASLNQLARASGTSKERVHYRMKRLERLGVITEYRTIVNSNRLGYASYRLLIKLRNATMEQEQELIRFLQAHPSIAWLVSVEGAWDVNAWILIRHGRELGRFVKELENRYKQFIKRMDIAYFYNVMQLTKAFLIGKSENNDPAEPFISDAEPVAHDETDIAILDALSRNARMPLIEVAKLAGLSTRQTRTRIQNLERKKVILGYRANIDFMRIGYTYFKLHIWLSNWSEEKTRRINNYARRLPNALYINYMLNGVDVELEFMTEGKEHMRAILAEFRNNFAEDIAEYELLEYPQQHKLVFKPEKESHTHIPNQTPA